MTHQLARPVTVATVTKGEASFVEIPAGTSPQDVPPEQLAQLSPDHFSNGKGKGPKDWRPARQQELDAEQKARIKALNEAPDKKAVHDENARVAGEIEAWVDALVEAARSGDQTAGAELARLRPDDAPAIEYAMAVQAQEAQS